MTKVFKGSNAVILPDSKEGFNPGRLSPIWMMQHLRLEANDFINDGAVQTPFLFYQPTKQFGLLVIPERIQMTFVSEREDEGELVSRVMREVLREFSQPPHSAAGFNFNWVVHSGELRNSEISRRLFANREKNAREKNSLFRFFEADDACFGAYASKDYLGTRMRVDAKPVILAQSNENNSEGILFNFNFHKELTTVDNRQEELTHLLQRWEEIRNEVRRIIGQINEECRL